MGLRLQHRLGLGGSGYGSTCSSLTGLGCCEKSLTPSITCSPFHTCLLETYQNAVSQPLSAVQAHDAHYGLQELLRKNHRNLVKKLRRQLAQKDKQLAQATAQIAIMQQAAAADKAESAALHAQAGAHAQANARQLHTHNSEYGRGSPVSTQQDASNEQCQVPQHQDRPEDLKERVANLEAQCDQYKRQQELAAGLYHDLQDDITLLKSKNYSLRVLGHE